MHTGRLIYVLLGAGLLVLVGVAAALTLGIGGPTLGGDPADLPGDASLASFTSSGGACVETAMLDSATEIRPGADTTRVTISANVTVSASNYALDEPTFERTGLTSYTLNVTSSEVAEKSVQDCDGVAQARYTANVSVPHASQENFTVVVRHDGEVVQRIENGGDESGVESGSGASAGSGSINW